MGTDISFFVERSKNDRWVSCDRWEYGQHLTLGDIVQDVPGSAVFYDDRNYDLFAILADVRNGYGFAGVDTGDEFNIIAKPRGLPNDLSPEVAELAEWIFEEGHTTASWLLLSEILAFDWGQTTTKRGFVNGPEYAEWMAASRDRVGSPPGYCAGIGPTMTRVTEPTMLKAANNIKGNDPAKVWRPKIKTELGNTYCHVAWEVTYRDRAGSFLTKTLPRMQKLGSPGHVRCVFWFG